MSREEAIKMLKDIGKYLCSGNPVWDTNKVAEAIRTAIVDMRMMPKYLEAFKAQKTEQWIPVSERLPEDLEEVNVTWVNHIPEPYYDFLKDKPFTGSAVYYRGEWFWYSSACVDILAEYGANDRDKVDDGIEIIAWCEMPEPYKEEQNNAHRGSNDSHIRPY